MYGHMRVPYVISYVVRYIVPCVMAYAVLCVIPYLEWKKKR